MAVPELKGVDLNNDAAVEQAIQKAVKNGKKPGDVNMAKGAVNKYRDAIKNAPKEQK
jgi:hypothetical protein